MMSELSAVPLPLVSEYSQDIHFGGLGLPVGFDDERLLVNVQALEQVRFWSGIGQLTITAGESSRETDGIEFDGVDPSGTAVLGEMRFLQGPNAKRSNRATTKVHWDHSGTYGAFENAFERSLQNRPGVAIAIDSGGQNHGSGRSGVTANPLLPSFQARKLNSGLKSGLRSANSQVNIDTERLMMTLKAHGAISLLVLACGLLLQGSPQEMVEVVPAINAVVRPLGVEAMFLSAAKRAAKRYDGVSWQDVFVGLNQGYRQSLFFGATLDRYAAGRLAVAKSRFIRARP